MTDVVLLHNSKAGDANRSSEELASLLRRHGYRPECFSLKDALKRMDPLERGEFIVVAGGDGSVKRVATKLANRSRPIAPLPIGTANNIAKSLGVTGDLDAVVAGWRHGLRRKLDLGMARGPWGERRFIEAIGIGLIGRAIATIEMIHDVSPHKFGRKEDKLYHDLSLLLALAHEVPPVRIEVTQDGEDRSGSYLLLEVLNISRAGPGFQLAKQADPSDGLLDVVSVRADERPKLEDSLKRCLAQLDHGTTLEAKQASRLRLELTAGELRLDDDIVWPPEGGRNDRSEGEQRAVVEVSVECGAVEFVLPPPQDPDSRR